MHSSLRYLLIVVALFAGALFAACSSDGDDNGDADSDEPTAEQPIDGDDADDADDDGDASGDLSSFAERFGVSEVKIEYDFTSFDATVDDEGNFEGSMTLYWKPPDAWRMDIGTPDGDISMITNGDTSYMCTAAAGEELCLESPAGGILDEIPFLNIFTDPDGFDQLIDTSPGVSVDQSSREIAGQDATCFTISGEADGESGAGEFCFRDDGVLLLMRATDDSGGEFSLEATSVSDSVSDEDFEPIYEVLDLGDLIP